jgi:hypothetical protein
MSVIVLRVVRTIGSRVAQTLNTNATMASVSQVFVCQRIKLQVAAVEAPELAEETTPGLTEGVGAETILWNFVLLAL